MAGTLAATRTAQKRTRSNSLEAIHYLSITMDFISNDPAPIGEQCFLCEETLTPPWLKTGEYRMHTACRDLILEDFEATHRRRLINPKTANDNIPPMGSEEWP
jgi:hypothetical protein